jgi:hypothetical protein
MESYKTVKNPVRNVVVEYKNKRSRKGNGSLWGNLDLKSISREVETAVSLSPIKGPAHSDISAPVANKAKNILQDDLPVIVADGKFEDDQTTREPDVVEAVGFEVDATVTNPSPKTERSENPSVGSTSIATSRRHKKGTTFSTTDKDLLTELTFLESENASLKGELITKLRLENENLSAMLARMGQRTAHKI